MERLGYLARELSCHAIEQYTRYYIRSNNPPLFKNYKCYLYLKRIPFVTVGCGSLMMRTNWRYTATELYSNYWSLILPSPNWSIVPWRGFPDLIHCPLKNTPKKPPAIWMLIWDWKKTVLWYQALPITHSFLFPFLGKKLIIFLVGNSIIPRKNRKVHHSAQLIEAY